MGFKFLKDNVSEHDAYIAQERFNELVGHQLQIDIPEPNVLSIDNRPAVFNSINRNLNMIDEDEMNFILQQQRFKLIEMLHMKWHYQSNKNLHPPH